MSTGPVRIVFDPFSRSGGALDGVVMVVVAGCAVSPVVGLDDQTEAVADVEDPTGRPDQRDGRLDLPYRRQHNRRRARPNRDLVVRGNRGHMGNPGAEELLYAWLDDAIAGRP
jgi:hypothetical protein